MQMRIQNHWACPYKWTDSVGERAIEMLKSSRWLPTILEESRESASISIKETPRRCRYGNRRLCPNSPWPPVRTDGYEREGELCIQVRANYRFWNVRYQATATVQLMVEAILLWAVGVQKSPSLFSGHHLGEEYVGMAAPFDIWRDMGMRVT